MTTKTLPRQEPDYGLSALAQELMPVLYNHRLVSTSQLHQLLRPDNQDSRYLRRELAALRERGLADAAKRRRAGAGELLSYLTPLGASVVEASGEVIPRTFRMTPQAASGQLQEHTLAVVEAGMAFLHTARHSNDECEPLDWTPEISHRIREGDDGTWDRAFLIPDSVLHYTRTSGRQRRLLTFFLEIDRATEPPATLVHKLAAYARYHSYTPATEPAGRGRARPTPAPRPAWTERYPGGFPTLLIILTGRSHRALMRRAGDVRALAAADPRLVGTDLRAGITTLEQLQTEGPWAPTVIPLLGDPHLTDVLLEPAADTVAA